MREISPEDMPGTKVRAGYQTVARLKEGTQSVVYKALGQEAGGKSLVLKILHGWLTENPQIAQAIENEIETLKKIDHESVASFVDSGRNEEGQIYLVSEYITGPDVGRLIDQKIELSISQILEMMIDACKGLQAALALGLMHGDLKPSTMIVDSKSRKLRVVDFGFASSLHFPNPDEPPCQTGQMPLLGGPGYLSPEQALGLPMDFRADIFSLGAVFYHLLSRQTIFDTSSEGEYLRLVSNSSPLTLKAANSDIPAGVDYVIVRMLAKSPDDRFADYASLISALEVANDEVKELQESLKQREESKAQSEMQQMEERENRRRNVMVGDLPDPEELETPKPAATKPEAPLERPDGPEKGPGVKVDMSVVEEAAQQRRGKINSAFFFGMFFFFFFIVIVVIASAGKTEAGSNEPGGIFAGIKSLFTPASQTEVDPELEWQLSNYNKMNKVQDALLTYRSQKGLWPRNMRILQEEGLLEAVDTLDEWGRPMVLMERSEVIVSFGPDREESTLDDWRMGFEGGLESTPSQLEEYFYEQSERE
jgi:serine/threonine protein kinase